MRSALGSLLAAALFGVATPVSKFLLQEFPAAQLAGLLYLGAALGVLPFAFRGATRPGAIDRRNLLRLAGAVAFGGVAGPLLVLAALRVAQAASVSLWLNLELIATALLGVAFFRDHLGCAGWLGVGGAMAGGLVLTGAEASGGFLPALLVAAACVCWGLDNHLTALIDGISATRSTFWKGLVAGVFNLVIGLLLFPMVASPLQIVAALGVGVLSYGASIVLYIVSAQRLGATRSQILFATAPLFGLVIAAAWLREPIEAEHLVAAALFVTAAACVFVSRHDHEHSHGAIEHHHEHRHDDGHHDHEHAAQPRSLVHAHWHAHEPIVHAHPHWPDLHHRHRH